MAAQAGSASAVGGNTRAADTLAPHRNLFNGNSCVHFYNPELWQPEGGPYSAKAIHRYVELLARSGVDTFLINPNAQVAWYPSKKLLNGHWPVFEGVETRDLLFPTGPYTQHTSDHLGPNFRLDAAQIRDGWNTILVSRERRSDGATVTIVSPELAVEAG